MSLQLAAASYIYIHGISGFKGKEKRTDCGDESRCTSRPAQAVTASPLDAVTAKYRQHTEKARNVTA
jgi:hypothetical protein